MMTRKKGKAKWLGKEDLCLPVFNRVLPACDAQRSGKGAGRGLGKGVISRLVTESVGTYRSKTEVVSA